MYHNNEINIYSNKWNNNDKYFFENPYLIPLTILSE